MQFFKENILKEIKKNEVGVKVCKNVLSQELISKLKIIKNSKSKDMIDRADSTKSSFDFNENDVFVELKKILISIHGDFFVNDFSPHFLTSKFPLRLHVDSGKDPEDVIGQNILIPLELAPADKSAHTVIFKNRWYGPAAYFTSKEGEGFDHILKDLNENFVDINDIRELDNLIDNINEEKTIEFSGGTFKVNSNFKEGIKKLIKSKRYNIRTNKHITEGKKFDQEIYNKYLTHQPYNELSDLEIKTIYKWEIGDILIWDRSLIHCSDNYLANGLTHKVAIPLFTSYTDKPSNFS